VNISRSSVYKVLADSKITYKKLYVKNDPYSHHKKEKLKKELFEKINNVNSNDIISIDETSIEINMRPHYGWSKRNTKCIIKNNKIIRKRVSLIMAVDKSKIVAYKIVEGSVNGEIFKDFILNNVLKNIDNKTLLMDNARIHHYKKFKEAINDTTSKVIYNIPYNPETNPIELVFSQIKDHIRKKNNNDNMIKLYKNIKSSMSRIKSEYLKACYKKSLNV
jgi:transposase